MTTTMMMSRHKKVAIVVTRIRQGSYSSPHIFLRETTPIWYASWLFQLQQQLLTIVEDARLTNCCNLLQLEFRKHAKDQLCHGKNRCTIMSASLERKTCCEHRRKGIRLVGCFSVEMIIICTVGSNEFIETANNCAPSLKF